MAAASVEDYVASIPEVAREDFARLRGLVGHTLEGMVADGALTGWSEKVSYGVLGFVPQGSRSARVFVAGYAGHVALYPVPDDPELAALAAPFRHGKGTLRFPLGVPLPEPLIKAVVRALVAR